MGRDFKDAGGRSRFMGLRAVYRMQPKRFEMLRNSIAAEYGATVSCCLRDTERAR